MEIDKNSFKQELLNMHARGFHEGSKDLKSSILDALIKYKESGVKNIPVEEMIEFIESVNTIKQYNH